MQSKSSKRISRTSSGVTGTSKRSRQIGHGGADIIAGGDPCQENSGARQGTGCESPSLGNEFIRIVAEIRPRIVLRENPTAVRADAPWPWFRFRNALEEIGYIVLPFRLRACCSGADHRRDRLWLLAALPDAMQTGLQGDEFLELAQSYRKEIRDITGLDRRITTPRICGRVDGIPKRMERIAGLGNAVYRPAGKIIGKLIRESFE